MNDALAYFAYGYFVALVLVVVAGLILWFTPKDQSRRLGRLRRRLGSWHRRRGGEDGGPLSGGRGGA